MLWMIGRGRKVNGNSDRSQFSLLCPYILVAKRNSGAHGQEETLRALAAPHIE